MTPLEAERAVKELLLTTEKVTRETKVHYIRLRSVLKNNDIEGLAEVLEEKVT